MNSITFVVGVQKNSLIETVILSTQNTCFGREIRKLVIYGLLFRGMKGNIRYPDSFAFLRVMPLSRQYHSLSHTIFDGSPFLELCNLHASIFGYFSHTLWS